MAGDAEDVTVIIGHRNRATHRTINALRAIAQQKFPHGRISLMVVDYGSRDEERRKLQGMVDEVRGTMIAVPGVTHWSRSHCLNIGLRRATTKYVMVSDSDVILAPNYLEACRAQVARDPLSIAVSSCVWLPECLDPALAEVAANGYVPEVSALRELGDVRTGHGYSTGMVFALTAFLKRIRGFDEDLDGYGSQDVDLVRRLRYLGLSVVSLDRETCYLHQWHPRYDGLPESAVRPMLARNAEHSRGRKSIVRNGPDWGTLGPSPGGEPSL